MKDVVSREAHRVAAGRVMCNAALNACAEEWRWAVELLAEFPKRRLTLGDAA